MAKSSPRPPADPPTACGQPARPGPESAIRAGVLRSLGRPADLFAVAVRTLWDGHYRVNIWTGPDAASARVARSYFVTADDDGVILTTTPRLLREFPSRGEPEGQMAWAWRRRCPHCRSTDVRPSRRRGWADRLSRLAFLRPFRCRTCSARFLRVASS